MTQCLGTSRIIWRMQKVDEGDSCLPPSDYVFAVLEAFLRTSPIPRYDAESQTGVWKNAKLKVSSNTNYCMLSLEHAPLKALGTRIEATGSSQGGVIEEDRPSLDHCSDKLLLFRKECSRLVKMLQVKSGACKESFRLHHDDDEKESEMSSPMSERRRVEERRSQAKGRNYCGGSSVECDTASTATCTTFSVTDGDDDVSTMVDVDVEDVQESASLCDNNFRMCHDNGFNKNDLDDHKSEVVPMFTRSQLLASGMSRGCPEENVERSSDPLLRGVVVDVSVRSATTLPREISHVGHSRSSTLSSLFPSNNVVVNPIGQYSSSSALSRHDQFVLLQRSRIFDSSLRSLINQPPGASTSPVRREGPSPFARVSSGVIHIEENTVSCSSHQDGQIGVCEDPWESPTGAKLPVGERYHSDTDISFAGPATNRSRQTPYPKRFPIPYSLMFYVASLTALAIVIAEIAMLQSVVPGGRDATSLEVVSPSGPQTSMTQKLVQPPYEAINSTKCSPFEGKAFVPGTMKQDPRVAMAWVESSIGPLAARRSPPTRLDKSTDNTRQIIPGPANITNTLFPTSRQRAALSPLHEATNFVSIEAATATTAQQQPSSLTSEWVRLKHKYEMNSTNGRGGKVLRLLHSSLHKQAIFHLYFSYQKDRKAVIPQH